MKYAIVTEGTWGDVLPLFCIGEQLQKKGDDVTVFTNSYYKSFVESKGLTFVATTDASLRETMLQNKMLWHPVFGLPVVLRYMATIFLHAYPTLKKHICSKEENEESKSPYDAVIGYQLSLAGKSVAEKAELPFYAICIAPIQVRSMYDLPVIFGGVNPNKWPKIMKKYFHHVGDLFILNRIAQLFLRKVHKELRRDGVTKISSVMTYTTTHSRVIGLWPEWYQQTYKDQSSWLQTVGFPAGVVITKGLTVALQEWLLQRKEKPIVVTLGSGHMFTDTLIAMLQEIARESHHRFIVLTPQADMYESSAAVFVAKNIDITAALEESVLFIHHGGAGSTAQAITTGVPSLVIPMSHDQPDNAYRITKNALGMILLHKHVSKKTLHNAITAILENETIKTNCAVAKEKTKHEDGITNAVTLIQSEMVIQQ